MASIQQYRPLIVGLAGGAVAGGALAYASTKATPDNALLKNAQYAPMLMLWNNVDAFRTIAMSGNPAAYGRQATFASAVVGAGAVVGVNTLFNTVTTYNTIDPGLNELESGDFRGSHLPRAFAYPAVGAAAGAALAIVPALLKKQPINTAALVKTTTMGGLAGGGAAMWQTASGQTRPYRPSTEDVGDVAATLHRGIAKGQDEVAVERALANVVDGDDSLVAGGRASSAATSSRFYALADKGGDADGMLSSAELEAHVRTFDADGDGRVSVDSGEWAKLHAAVVEGVSN